MSEALSVATLWPEIILLIGGCIVLLLGQARQQALRVAVPWATLVTLAVVLFAFWLEVRSTDGSETPAQAGFGLYYCTLATFVRLAALELGILLTLINWSQSREQEQGEFLAMMLFSLCGLLLVGAADNLFVLFLALELVSIPTYVMVVLSRSHERALEAGTKYFYLGAMSAAIMAYGFSFLYGVAGTATLTTVYDDGGQAVTLGVVDAVSDALQQSGTLAYGLALVGVVLSVGGLLFKIAAVPLHFYIADVYQGAASSVAGLLGFVPKLAGLVAIFKIVQLTGYWEGGARGLFWMLWLVAVASMCIGNVLALRQHNIKRMLGYSGIAHAGYMLVGVLAGPLAGSGALTGSSDTLWDGSGAVLYYVVIYGIANLTAFAVLGLLRVRSGGCETLRDIAGLLRREPALALLMALAMFTLMGLPPTPGFWGKFSLFGSALAAARATGDGWLLALVIIGVLNSALAAAYYLRVIAAVLLYENDRPAFAVQREAPIIGSLLCGFLLLIFAFWPNLLLHHGQRATRELHESGRVVSTITESADDVGTSGLPSADAAVLAMETVAPRDE